MRLLLDTHILIWLATDPARVPAPLRSAIEHAETRYVSAISAAEIAIKHKKFGDKFGFTPAHLQQAMADLACQELPLYVRHSEAYLRIPLAEHKNPHDQLLMAQAITEELILVTADRQIRQHSLPGLRLLC